MHAANQPLTKEAIMDPSTTSHQFRRFSFITLLALGFATANCSTTNKKEVKVSEDKNSPIPKVFMPGATCETVKEKIEGRRWEQSHLVCNLKDAVWSPQ
jgi:hypothetical protein